MSTVLRRLYSPEPVEVRTAADGVPTAVAGVAVEALRERWVVDDRWWVPRAWLHREYFELALADGCAVVVFRSLHSEHWFKQRA
ncbi:MAG TPA: hypothetical protein VFB52_10205 [Solirubrobacterales bacterium]|nr:hypothetical protein [Solirubrobacterales bacterium]